MQACKRERRHVSRRCGGRGELPPGSSRARRGGGGAAGSGRGRAARAGAGAGARWNARRLRLETRRERCGGVGGGEEARGGVTYAEMASGGGRAPGAV